MKPEHKFEVTESFLTLIGVQGERGELKQATLYSRGFPLVCINADLSDLDSFDGMAAFNTQGEVAQLIGLRFHKGATNFPRMELMKTIVRLTHGALGKGRVYYRNIYGLKVKGDRITDFKFNLCWVDKNSVVYEEGLNSSQLGSNRAFLTSQCLKLKETLESGFPKGIRYASGMNPVSKTPEFEPLFSK